MAEVHGGKVDVEMTHEELALITTALEYHVENEYGQEEEMRRLLNDLRRTR